MLIIACSIYLTEPPHSNFLFVCFVFLLTGDDAPAPKVGMLKPVITTDQQSWTKLLEKMFSLMVTT